MSLAIALLRIYADEKREPEEEVAVVGVDAVGWAGVDDGLGTTALLQPTRNRLTRMPKPVTRENLERI